jgi:hypothetical protein
MQTIGSRIAQTGLSCHCPSCVTAGASGLARRTTSAAARRPVRWALSSTFVYSGIFAAAATTDAGFKQKRREQWDRAIADIKHDLHDSRLDKSTTTQDLAQHKQEKGEYVQAEQEKEETVPWKPLFEDPQEAVLEDWHQEVAEEGPVWPTNTGFRLHRNFVAPNSIYARSWHRERALASRWTTKKLRTTEFTVDKLILRMLLHLDELDSRTDLKNAVPESCQDFFGAPTAHLKALLLYTNDKHLEATTFPDSDADAHSNEFPRQHKFGVTYKQDDFGDFHHTSQDLNSAIAQLFQKQKSGGLAYKDLVAKIAYNLYISSAAPSLDCWNTLLCGFMQCENTYMVNPTLYAIRNANVRQNETTIKATLRYFIMINSPTKFAGFVDQIRGLGNGLMLAKPTITVSDSGRPRLVVKETGKIVQKPYHTPAVFELIVQGVLRFAGFEAAIRIWKDMRSEGWGLSMRGLTPLLDDRARNADYEAGCQIWDLIKQLQEESKVGDKPERLFARTYSAMLRLCSACDNMTRFDEILREARAAKYQHQELLRMFKQEMLAGSSPIPRLDEPDSRIHRYFQNVTQADLEGIEIKEPERNDQVEKPTIVDEEFATMSATPAVTSSTTDAISSLETQDEYAWLEAYTSTVSDRVLEDDDAWLDSPMDAARN